jgi:cbb3-type cytochrome oxidase subunit 3
MDTINGLFGTWWTLGGIIAAAAVVIYVFNPRRKKQFEKDSKIPFDDK